jgi:hypothetical protein
MKTRMCMRLLAAVLVILGSKLRRSSAASPPLRRAIAVFGVVIGLALASVSGAAVRAAPATWSGSMRLNRTATTNAAVAAAKVSVGSPSDQTPRNHQNEPAVAIDAHNPDFVVAGAIDYIDKQRCPQAAATQLAACEDFPRPGAGRTGIYFSFDRGRTWTQPTYDGWTARDCPTADVCDGYFGRIGTVPWYYEAGLQADGDPAVAIGPRPVNGHFSWANGSRVYVATLVSDFPGRSTLKGFGGLGVSRLDNPTPSRVEQKSSWAPPVVVESRNPTAFRDKEQIWVDNSESSRFFGNAYMCFSEARGTQPVNYPFPLLAATSTDGGDHWEERVIAGGKDPDAGKRGTVFCTIRTDSRGVVYLFAVRYTDADFLELPRRAEHVLFKSFDGGEHWSKARRLFSVTDTCLFVDPLSGRCVIDGYSGTRVAAAVAPAVDIANGAPTGAGATDLILDAWTDGGAGLNAERARLSWSSDGGRSWAQPITASLPGDRPLYAAPAISPVGDRAYLVYEAVTSPWRGFDMNSARPDHGVFLTAPVGVDGPGPWATAYSGAFGDLRASFPGHRLSEERIGDYVYAAASRDYGVGVWIDARDAAVCPAIQAWRGQSLAAGAPVIPAPWPLADCPPTFGNTDVWAATTG